MVAVQAANGFDGLVELIEFFPGCFERLGDIFEDRF
jgi:hypothetical protein